MDNPNVQIATTAKISPDARIVPSVRGSRLTIGENTQIFEFAVIRYFGGPGDIVIGDNVSIGPHCVLYSGSGITIHNDVQIGPGCKIVPANHATSDRDSPIRSQGFAPPKGGVVIEQDVWLAADVVVLDGAYIEHGAVIAAGSVVTGRVPAFQVWGGSPAHYLKDR